MVIRIFLSMQALELIQELQKHFPIKRCPLRIRVAAPEEEVSALLEKLNVWKAIIISKEGSAGQISVVSPYCSSFMAQFPFQFRYTGLSACSTLAFYVLKV